MSKRTTSLLKGKLIKSSKAGAGSYKPVASNKTVCGGLQDKMLGKGIRNKPDITPV
jgi:hypothetical protein